MKQTAAFLCRWALLFFLTSVLVFVLVRMMPVTPEEQWLTTYKLPHSEENLAYVREQMGLNKPLPVQYARWITRFLSGDWGLSLVSRVDIRSQFVRKLPPSLSIGLLGTLLGAGTGLALGYGAAFRRRGVCDRLSSFLSVFSQSVPAFLLSLLIIQLLSVQLKYPHQISGGQLQRLAIARALLVRPELLVADEIVSALDVSVQNQILTLLADLRDQYGLSILFISHDLAVVRKLSDRVLVMRDGRLLGQGRPGRPWDAGADPYVRELHGCIFPFPPPGPAK